MSAAAVDEMATSSLAPLLDSALDRLRLALSLEQRGQLLRYLALLAHWNKTYNLTSVREPRAMLSQHVLDCLSTIEPLRRETAMRSGRRLLDVGSGAGLPGIVVAIAAPEFQVTCVDSVGKKTAFIAQAAGILKLANVEAVHGRVEAMGEPPFDVIASRAFSAVSTFVANTRKLLAPGGTWMAMKGQNPAAELALLDSAAFLFHVEPLVVPDLEAERCIAWIRTIKDSERTHP